MYLIIDGYNLLHVNRSLTCLSSAQLRWERERLVDQLSAYQKLRSCKMTVVFDGWLGGWSTEKMEKKRELEIIYSRLGEKADEVIKRLVREKGSEAVVITSDQEISRFGERLNVAVIPSEKFVEKLTTSSDRFEESLEEEGGEGRIHRKGLARRPSKREKRARAALKKL